MNLTNTGSFISLHVTDGEKVKHRERQYLGQGCTDGKLLSKDGGP